MPTSTSAAPHIVARAAMPDTPSSSLDLTQSHAQFLDRTCHPARFATGRQSVFGRLATPLSHAILFSPAVLCPLQAT